VNVTQDIISAVFCCIFGESLDAACGSIRKWILPVSDAEGAKVSSTCISHSEANIIVKFSCEELVAIVATST
jgi:hypothetical protein